MAGHVRTRAAEGTWVVRAAGAVIGESDAALILSENGYEDRVYFPRSDLAMAFLERSEKHTICPFKGRASYFHIETKSGTWADAGWSYEDPIDEVREIAELISFDTDRVTVEEL